MAPRKKRKTEALAPSSVEDPSKGRKAAPEDLLGMVNATQLLKKRKSAPKETSTTSRRHTRGMTTDAARKAVFNTSELFEPILVCLPPKTLFGVQRVSKQFQAIIATSIPIQEKMFLRIRNKPQAGWTLRNRLTEYHFVESTELEIGTYLPTDLNPLFEIDNSGRTVKDTPSARVYRQIIGEKPKLVLGIPLTLSSLDGKGPSILDTYISDPPFDDVEVSYVYQLPEHSIEVCRHMIDEEQRGNGTLRDLICQTMVGEGTAHIGSGWHKGSLGLRGYMVTDEPRLVIEESENRSRPMAGFNPGISEINLTLRHWVLPTEAERAEVKARGTGA